MRRTELCLLNRQPNRYPRHDPAQGWLEIAWAWVFEGIGMHARRPLVEPGLVEPGLVEPGLVEPGLVEPGSELFSRELKT
jgi:hypothetical protein